MDTAQRRRVVGGFARIGLVVLALLIVVTWGSRRFRNKVHNISVERQPVPTEALGPGDLRIYNSDSAVDLTLRGRDVLAGLSPKTVDKIRNEMDRSSTSDTTGFGGMIAATVKKTVAASIGTHIVYPVSDIREISYDGGEIVIDSRAHGKMRLFSNTNVNKGGTRGFREEDARRFIAAVKARQAESLAAP